MELSTYLRVMWRRKWIIIPTFIIVVSITGIGTWLTPRVYEASAKLHMTTVTRGSLDFVDYEISYAERLMNTYVDVATSSPVQQELAARLGITRAQLPAVSVDIIANTELMLVTAKSADPVQAQAAANALANIIVAQSRILSSKTELVRQETLVRELAQLEAEITQAQESANALDDGVRATATRRNLSTQLDANRLLYASLSEMHKQAQIREVMLANTLSVISTAELPQTPVQPNPLLNLALGMAVGLIGGLGLAFLFENLAMESYTDRLEALVIQNPRSFGHTFTEWTPQRLNDQMMSETGIRLSATRMRALLDDMGYDYRPQPIPHEFEKMNGHAPQGLPERAESQEKFRRIPVHPPTKPSVSTPRSTPTEDPPNQVVLWRKRS